MAKMASSTSYSDLSNVLKMIAKEFKQFSVFDLTKSNMILVISVVLMNIGSSLSRMFFMLGIQSIDVSNVPSSLKLSSIAHDR